MDCEGLKKTNNFTQGRKAAKHAKKTRQMATRNLCAFAPWREMLFLGLAHRHTNRHAVGGGGIAGYGDGAGFRRRTGWGASTAAAAATTEAGHQEGGKGCGQRYVPQPIRHFTTEITEVTENRRKHNLWIDKQGTAIPTQPGIWISLCGLCALSGESFPSGQGNQQQAQQSGTHHPRPARIPI